MNYYMRTTKENPDENQLLNPSAPISTKNFSTQISIHSSKNYVERIERRSMTSHYHGSNISG